MPPERAALDTSTMLALASEILSASGYRVARDLTEMTRLGEGSLVAEDAFSVVSLVAFETWQQLETEWLEAQADLVDLLSRRLARAAPKAWDGYLVLLSVSDPLDPHAAMRIERDTTRVRKIIATGSTLQTAGDVEQVLDLLLPLKLPDTLLAVEDVLDTLPDHMRGLIDPADLRTVIEAFRTMEPPLERLHARRAVP